MPQLDFPDRAETLRRNTLRAAYGYDVTSPRPNVYQLHGYADNERTQRVLLHEAHTEEAAWNAAYSHVELFQPLIIALQHLDGSELTFQPTQDGQWQVVLDLQDLTYYATACLPITALMSLYLDTLERYEWCVDHPVNLCWMGISREVKDITHE